MGQAPLFEIPWARWRCGGQCERHQARHLRRTWSRHCKWWKFSTPCFVVLCALPLVLKPEWGVGIGANF
ncbi:hypothetical protein M408DRAFT_217918 [Serendipita vermifera MAFF 305830]|uniref:Uncharacterized protein n=1 Tax=Serendipita vermifera MAFF 305830 TaxID=933852 RepID=A0A0C3BJW3_SERVB|nr:hypothetical protein M408DRAFT_217918 [Serendipita vermifera MAFF 305830]